MLKDTGYICIRLDNRFIIDTDGEVYFYLSVTIEVQSGIYNMKIIEHINSLDIDLPRLFYYE